MSDKFEKTFSQLVENRLKESAPFLMKYAVGFEIKDRNDEGTKGFGVYAFLIGKIPAYIPVVYNKGELDGFDLLWLADQRLMVPAVSNWVSAVKDKGQGIFGKILEKPDVRLKSVQRPESVVMESSTFPYAIKTASEDGGIVGPEVIKGMYAGTGKDAKVSGILEEVLSESPNGVAALCKTASENPEFADALHKMYGGTGILRNLVEKSKQSLEKKAEEDKKVPMEHGNVKVITSMDDPSVPLLKPAEKRKLMKTGSFILDNRENHTTVFNKKLASDMLTNPGKSGFCRVLQMDGTMKDAWVGRIVQTHHEKFPDKNSYVAVVLKDSSDKAVIYPHNKIYVSDMDNIDSFEVGNMANKDLVTQIFKAAEPEEGPPDIDDIFPVGCGLFDSSEEMVYKINTDLGKVKEGKPGLIVTLTGRPFRQQDEACGRNYDMVFSESEGEGLKFGTDFIRVGPKTKAIKILPPEGLDFRPGKPDIFNDQLVKNAGLSELKIACDNTSVSTRLDDTYSGISTEEREFRRIVFDMGVDPGTARQMVKTAKDSENGEAEYLLKMADAVESLHDDPETDVVIEQRPNITVVENAQESGQLLDEARETAVEAAEAGYKDLFEITALRGLMEVVEDSSLRKNSFVKLLRGMDECGRSLFRLFWKRDEMEEEYGKEDIGRLEDSLRSNFNSLGELVLFLEDKFTSLHGPFENSMEGLLAEDIGETEA